MLVFQRVKALKGLGSNGGARADKLGELALMKAKSSLPPHSSFQGKIRLEKMAEENTSLNKLHIPEVTSKKWSLFLRNQ